MLYKTLVYIALEKENLIKLILKYIYIYKDLVYTYMLTYTLILERYNIIYIVEIV